MGSSPDLSRSKSQSVGDHNYIGFKIFIPGCSKEEGDQKSPIHHPSETVMAIIKNRWGKSLFALLTAIFFVVLFAVHLAEAYSHQYYMQCCQGCNRMPQPQARAVCYAACMATAAGMSPP